MSKPKIKDPFDFSLEEFIINGDKEIDRTVADKLYKYHIMQMQPVRDKMKVWITASANSGYRSLQWEKNHGRSGNSQHTYGEQPDGSFDPNEYGAVDWTCKDFVKNKDKFLELIIKKTQYNRIAVYDTFIHCDHKPGRRALFNGNANNGQWGLIEYLANNKAI